MSALPSKVLTLCILLATFGVLEVRGYWTCENPGWHCGRWVPCRSGDRDARLDSWSGWSEWSREDCRNVRTRTRRCCNYQQFGNGKYCNELKLKDTQIERNDNANCGKVEAVFIYTHYNFYVKSAGDLWVRLRQGNTICETNKPTWEGPIAWNEYYEKKDTGCDVLFDKNKAIDIEIQNDSSDFIYIYVAGVQIGVPLPAPNQSITNSVRWLWQVEAGPGYKRINSEENPGWLAADFVKLVRPNRG